MQSIVEHLTGKLEVSGVDNTVKGSQELKTITVQAKHHLGKKLDKAECRGFWFSASQYDEVMANPWSFSSRARLIGEEFVADSKENVKQKTNFVVFKFGTLKLPTRMPPGQYYAVFYLLDKSGIAMHKKEHCGFSCQVEFK